MESLKLKDLKRQSSKLGLPTSGKKSELIARLKSHHTSSKEPPITETGGTETISPSDTIECLIGTSISADVADIIETARQQLQRAAGNDPLQEEYLSDDRMVITNNHGTFWTRMEARMDRLEHETTGLKHETTGLTQQNQKREQENQKLEQDLKQTTAELRLAITDLQRATFGFRDFRHRFISTYKRDVLQQIDDSDRKYIRHGNAIVHSGNLKYDAELYSGSNCRNDKSVFRRLYGVLPTIAATIGKY